MEKEDAVNILQFWLAADNFQSQLAAKKGQYDGQEAQNDAMILYDKWVLLIEIFSIQQIYYLIGTLEIKMNKLSLCSQGAQREQHKSCFSYGVYSFGGF